MITCRQIAVCLGLILWGIHLPVPAWADPVSCGQIPADIVLMLDRTPSVSALNRQLEAEAAKGFLDRIAQQNVGSLVAIGRFGGANQNPLAEISAALSGDYTSLKATVDQALSTDSYTNTHLQSAVSVGQVELNAHAIHERRVLIILSDGEANLPAGKDGSPALAQQAAAEAKQSGSIVITIAFDSSTAQEKSFRDGLAVMATQPSSDDSTGDITATVRETENRDGDYFFIAPTGAELEGVFKLIFEKILLCDDANPCTVDECSSSEHTCSFTLILGCQACQSAVDCDDGNPCTTDTCEVTGVCSYPSISGCPAPVAPACPDRDVDGVCDDHDNCPDLENPQQGDEDGDGLGDICDIKNHPTVVAAPNAMLTQPNCFQGSGVMGGSGGDPCGGWGCRLGGHGIEPRGMISMLVSLVSGFLLLRRGQYSSLRN